MSCVRLSIHARSSGARHVLVLPVFTIFRQLSAALALRHPSALIAIVLSSDKLQIALAQKANNVINDHQKQLKHIVSPFPKPVFPLWFYPITSQVP